MSRRTNLTNLQFAILGLIGQGEKSAYTIQKIFTETPMARYSASPGAIYPATRRLEESKLVVSRRESGEKGRARKVYATTAAGEKQLGDWLRQPSDINEVTREADIAMLRFAFMGGRLSDAEIRRFLSTFIVASQAHRADLDRRRERFLADGVSHAALTLQAGVMGVDAQLRWAKQAARAFAG